MQRNRLYRCFHPPDDAEYADWPARTDDRQRLAQVTVDYIAVMLHIYEYDDTVGEALTPLYQAAVRQLEVQVETELGGEG